jgi:hypothetical protein
MLQKNKKKMGIKKKHQVVVSKMINLPVSTVSSVSNRGGAAHLGAKTK